MPVTLWTDTTTGNTIGLAGTDLASHWFGLAPAPDGYGMIAKSFEHRADAEAYAQGLPTEHEPVDRLIDGAKDYTRPAVRDLVVVSWDGASNPVYAYGNELTLPSYRRTGIDYRTVKSDKRYDDAVAAVRGENAPAVPFRG